MVEDVIKYLRNGDRLTNGTQARISMGDAYMAVCEMEASGTPLVVPLKGVLGVLMQMARDRSNVHGTGCSGWLGELVWLPDGPAPKPAAVVEYAETRSTQSIMVKTGVGKFTRMYQLELSDLGKTFFRTPEEAMGGGIDNGTEE